MSRYSGTMMARLMGIAISLGTPIMYYMLPILVILISYAVSSDNGAYSASVTYTRSTTLTVESFTLYNRGEALYTKHGGALTTFFISNSGTVFAMNECELDFFDARGDVIMLKRLVFPNGFGFSPDNVLFFASDSKEVCAFAETGELVYTFSPGRLFSSTERGEIVAIVSTDSLFVYTHGELAFTQRLATAYVRRVSFSPDRKTIIVTEPTHNEVFDVQTGRRIE